MIDLKYSSLKTRDAVPSKSLRPSFANANSNSIDHSYHFIRFNESHMVNAEDLPLKMILSACHIHSKLCFQQVL